MYTPIFFTRIGKKTFIVQQMTNDFTSIDLCLITAHTYKPTVILNSLYMKYLANIINC